MTQLEDKLTTPIVRRVYIYIYRAYVGWTPVVVALTWITWITCKKILTCNELGSLGQVVAVTKFAPRSAAVRNEQQVAQQ